MALMNITFPGMSLNQRGQGVVESLFALPVFLALVCIIFQLFLLGIAQVQLQYAAFYAARVGAVNGKNEEIMLKTVQKLLPGTSNLQSRLKSPIKIELLNQEPKVSDHVPDQDLKDTPLMVRVHWHYPLTVPFVDRFLGKRRPGFPEPPSVHLQASWAMEQFGQRFKEKIDANTPGTSH